MLLHACVALCAASWCACGPESTDGLQTARRSDAIVGGELDTGDPAVVVLTAESLPLCTGTLIAPHTVLTAGHCIQSLGATVTYYAGFGSDVDHLERRIKLARQVTHPSYTGEGKPFDLGVVELSTAVNDIAPVAVRATPLTDSDVGVELRHVGFGVSDESAGTGRGLKRDVRYPLNRIDGELFWSGAPGKQTCDGDSGGPAFVGDELVAVVSDGPNCHEDGADARADTQGAWLADATAQFEPAAEPPPATTRSGCGATGGSGLNALLALVIASLVMPRRRRAPR